jgi:hypothetical protein
LKKITTVAIVSDFRSLIFYIALNRNVVGAMKRMKAFSMPTNSQIKSVLFYFFIFSPIWACRKTFGQVLGCFICHGQA